MKNSAVRVGFIVLIIATTVSGFVSGGVSIPINASLLIVDVSGVIVISVLLPVMISKNRWNGALLHAPFFPVKKSWITWVYWSATGAFITHLCFGVEVIINEDRADYNLIRASLAAGWMVLVARRMIWDFSAPSESEA